MPKSIYNSANVFCNLWISLLNLVKWLWIAFSYTRLWCQCVHLRDIFCKWLRPFLHSVSSVFNVYTINSQSQHPSVMHFMDSYPFDHHKSLWNPAGELTWCQQKNMCYVQTVPGCIGLNSASCVGEFNGNCLHSAGPVRVLDLHRSTATLSCGVHLSFRSKYGLHMKSNSRVPS